MSGMSKIVKTIASIAIPFTTIYGLYIIVHGHLTPGGGFQGGAVIASGFVMLIVAFGSSWVIGAADKKEKHEEFEHFEHRISYLESTGALMFIALAFLGLFFGAVFFNNFLVGNEYLFGVIPSVGSTEGLMNTAGVLPLMNIAVGLKVVAGLFIIVLVMAYATSKKGGVD